MSQGFAFGFFVAYLVLCDGDSDKVFVASFGQGGDVYATLSDRELGDCRAVAWLFRDGRAIICKGDER